MSTQTLPLSPSPAVHVRASLASDRASLPSIDGLFGESHDNLVKLDMNPFLRYCGLKFQEFMVDNGQHLSVTTKDEVEAIAALVRDGRERNEVETFVRGIGTRKVQEDDAIAASMDLCASLLSMAEIGKRSFAISGRRSVNWTDGSLKSTLSDYFTADMELSVSATRLEAKFLGRNLYRIGGLRVEWIDNLASHLRLADDDKTVFIFHHASFLKLQTRKGSRAFSVLPDGLAEETLRTFALLFPQKDEKTRRWIRSQQREAGIDPAVAKCGNLLTEDIQFERFSFWHDRLVILKQAFDDSRPRTLGQWWWDRRNIVQWYTFWVAILVLFLTVVFGIIQSVEGGLQVTLSYKSLAQG